MLKVDYKMRLDVFQFWSWGPVLYPVVEVLAALDANRRLRVGLWIHRKPQTAHLRHGSSSVLSLVHWWGLYDTTGHCWMSLSLHPGMLWCLLFLVCSWQTKASFFFFSPPSLYSEFMWSSPGSLHPPFYFHLKMFNFNHTCYFAWAPVLPTCSRGLSFPLSVTQSLIRPPCICLCCSSTWEPSLVFMVWL